MEEKRKKQGKGKKDNVYVVDIRKMPNGKMIKIPSFGIILIITILLSTLVFFYRAFSYKGEEVSVSNIVYDISEKNYEKIILKDDMVVLEQKDEFEGKPVITKKFAMIPLKMDFYQVLSDSDINIKDLKDDFYEPQIGVTFGDIITLLFLGSVAVFGYMMIKNMQASGGKIMDFGESKARLLFGKKTGTTFDDVAGVDDSKQELTEIVDFLQNPKKYRDLGARIPRGVLLAGAPGTGKTLLAKAVAGEAGVPFFHTSGSEFEEMLVGAGASRVRDLFKKARKAAPCIIFIDEIDAVAKKRGTVLHSGAGEQTLNQILVEMDGLEDRENVIVLAATNRPDVLDPAILRPGRFDRMVVVNMPDAQGRKEILEVHAKNKKFAKNVDLGTLAKKTIGYSGADLENILNEAAIMAAQDGDKEIGEDDLAEAFLKVKLGRKKNPEKEAEDLKKTAYHEAGHAIVSRFTPGSDPVEQVSIIPRGLTGGVTVYLPEKERKTLYKNQMLAWLRSGVAGRASEELFLDDISSGASADIEQATEVAKEMVMKYGMSEKLGMVKYGDLDETSHLGYSYGGGRDFSEDTAKMIDSEVKRLIEEAYVDAKKVLSEHKKDVEKLVKVLLEKEVVIREEFDALFE